MITKLVFKKAQKESGYTEEDMKVRMQFYPNFRYDAYSRFILVCPSWIMIFICVLFFITSCTEADVFDIIYWGLMSALMIYCNVKIRMGLNLTSSALKSDMYFRKYLQGAAVSREDYKIIRSENADLYVSIMTTGCQGHCYPTCFELLKTLKKGKITIIALPMLENDRRIEGIQRPYTAHVLYENHCWIFDTYTCRQYRKKDFYEIFGIANSMEWKSFDYFDIERCHLDCKEFQKKYGPSFSSWCEAVDCFEVFSKIDA